MKPEGTEPDRQMSFKRALGWSYVMQGGQYAITTAITFVLAAILGPSIFGLVAMASVYLMFIQMALRQGMLPAIVQRKTLERSHLDSAFWLVVGSGVVLTGLSLLLSAWWAELNRTPELEIVINVMSVIIPLQALVVVQEAILSRHMDFKSLALRSNAAALVGGVIGLAMAILGFGVWALVAQHIIKSFVDVIAIWSLSDWRPRATFSWSSTKEILGFSSSTAAAGFGSFLSTRSDALLIGLFFGPTAVGLYRLAARLVEIVTYVTTSPFQAVALPELSRVQADPQLFAERATRIVKLAALIAFPALGILAGSSRVLIGVLGPEWEGTAAPLSVLCLVGGIVSVTLFSGPILLAAGRPRVLAAVTWVSGLVSAGSFVVAGLLLDNAAVDNQVLGVALIRLAVFSTVALVMVAAAIARYSPLSIPPLLRSLLPGVLAGGFSAVSALFLGAIPWTGADLTHLALVVMSSFILTVVLMWWIEPTVRQAVVRGTHSIKRAWLE